jgi:CDP-4-dehydro-6-deoxyglucose reductase, E3
MSHRVRVRPSGHQFDAEPSETLLQAGLRAGLNLDHGCANGSCGECRARLLEGQVAPCGHADYCFSAREKAEGWLLLCSCQALGDLVIDTHESGSAAEIPLQRVRARVSRIERLQEDMIQLTLRTPRSQGLHFLAGQGMRLGLDGLTPTTLAIASCPCDSVQLRFHLRRRPGDPFSERVFAGLRKNVEVTLEGPVGDFTLDEESTRPLVFIAWESGFAAISSLIDHAIQKDENRSIDLYWLSAIPRGHYLSNYCRAWRDVLDDFRYHSIDLAPAGDERIEDVIERVVRVHAVLGDHDYYLALPSPALAAAQGFLDAAAIPPGRRRVTALEFP